MAKTFFNSAIFNRFLTKKNNRFAEHNQELMYAIIVNRNKK